MRRTGTCALTLLALTALVAPITAHASSSVSPRSQATPAAQVTDPVGDANYINDAGRSGLYGTPFFGNVVTDPDLDDGSDLEAVWFSHDAKTISLHIQTEALVGFEDETRLYYVRANPGAPFPYVSDCLMWLVVLGSEGPHLNTNYARVSDHCVRNDNLGPVIDLHTELMPDGSGVVTATAPRDYSPLFDRGKAIVAPWAYSKLSDGVTSPIDTTVRGADYSIKR